MNKHEYFEFHREFCQKMIEVTKKKNKDYTGDSGDPFANFRVVDKLGICSVAQGFLVRMSDKFIRLVNLADGRETAVTDESLTDTLHDLANYCALFAGYLTSSKTTSKHKSTFPQILYELYAKGRRCETKIGVFQTRQQAEAVLQHQKPNWPTFELYIQELGEVSDDAGHSEIA